MDSIAVAEGPHRFDIVWAAADDVKRCDKYLKTLSPHEQQTRGLRAPWRDCSPSALPEKDGQYKGKRGHRFSVNIPGIQCIPNGFIPVPNSNPLIRICTCKEFIEFHEVDGLVCGNVLPAFWTRPEVKEAIKKQALVERDKAKKLQSPPKVPEKRQSSRSLSKEDIATLTRRFFETIAWRTGSSNVPEMPDQVLYDTFIMVKITKQIPLPSLDLWLAANSPEDEIEEAEEPVVTETTWTQWTWEEFLDYTLRARGSVVSGKTRYKDARTGQIRDQQ